MTQVSTSRLNRLADLVDRGALKIHLDKVFPLDKAWDASQRLEQDHPRGKVVLEIKET